MAELRVVSWDENWAAKLAETMDDKTVECLEQKMVDKKDEQKVE